MYFSGLVLKRFFAVFAAFIVLPAFMFSGSGILADADSSAPAFSDAEGHYPVKLTGTDARVGAYKKAGRIKRLYGEAFSHGATPQESAETFLAAHAHLFGVSPADLSFINAQPVMYEPDTGGYKFTALNFTQHEDDIPVFRTRLVLLVRNEAEFPLVLASVDLRDMGDDELFTRWENLDPGRGIDAAIESFPNLIDFTEPDMVVWAGVNDTAAEPVLAYTFVGDNGYEENDDTPEKYLFVADAGTGGILYRENLIIFTDMIGSVKGKATQGKAADFCEVERPEAMPYARVAIGDVIAYCDDQGYFMIPHIGSSPVIIQALLKGRWFTVRNYAGDDARLNLMAMPPCFIDFMHNDSNIGEFYRAQVNAYLQANVVRDFTLKYNPAYPGLQQNEFPITVNRQGGNCPGNAWYDGYSLNFCAAASRYPNTAWSTVVHHEYGHHLVAMAGSGQGAYGEGMGDVMGILITDDPGIGYGFFGENTCGQPLRNGDNNLQYPCNGEIHHCGQLISGCVWETRNELFITHPKNYREILASLAINAMLVHTGDSIDPTIPIDYLVLDDDNDDIFDGTPHRPEIETGFARHNMAPELYLHLTEGRVTPTAGYYGQHYEFQVHYHDPAGHLPSTVEVYVDGVSHGMSHCSGSETEGDYCWSTGDLDVGVPHEFYYYTENTEGDIYRIPESGTFSGPIQFKPEISWSGSTAPGETLAIEVWGVPGGRWAAAWSSEPGPYTHPVNGLTYDIGPGDIHIIKGLNTRPLYLGIFGRGVIDVTIPEGTAPGIKYLQATTKFGPYWAKSNQASFVVE